MTTNLESHRIAVTCSVKAAVLKYSQHVPAKASHLLEALKCNT